jgi:hypothetical protein
MGLLLDFFLLSVARSLGGFSANLTKIYCYLAKSHQFKFSKFRYFSLLASFFYIVTDNTKTKLIYNFRYLATLLLSGGHGFRKI